MSTLSEPTQPTPTKRNYVMACVLLVACGFCFGNLDELALSALSKSYGDNLLAPCSIAWAVPYFNGIERAFFNIFHVGLIPIYFLAFVSTPLVSKSDETNLRLVLTSILLLPLYPSFIFFLPLIISLANVAHDPYAAPYIVAYVVMAGSVMVLSIVLRGLLIYKKTKVPEAREEPRKWRPIEDSALVVLLVIVVLLIRLAHSTAGYIASAVGVLVLCFCLRTDLENLVKFLADLSGKAMAYCDRRIECTLRRIECILRKVREFAESVRLIAKASQSSAVRLPSGQLGASLFLLVVLLVLGYSIERVKPSFDNEVTSKLADRCPTAP